MEGDILWIIESIPEIVDFSSNINPAGMPASVKLILKTKTRQIDAHYPDLHSSNLSIWTQKIH